MTATEAACTHHRITVDRDLETGREEVWCSDCDADFDQIQADCDHDFENDYDTCARCGVRESALHGEIVFRALTEAELAELPF